MADNHRKEDEIDLLLGDSTLEHNIPPQVEQRLRARFTEFRQRLEDGGVVRKSEEAPSRYARRLWWSIAALATCATIAVGVSLVLTQTQTPAWAGIVRTVQQRPWIHCTTEGSSQKRMEFWFSSTQGNRKLAASFGNVDFATFVTLEDRQTLSYRKRESKVHRQTLRKAIPPKLGLAGALISTFAPYDQLVQQLNQDARLVSQSRHKTTQDEQTWIQYEFVFEEAHGKQERFVDTFLVEIDTKLPRWWIRSSPDDNKSLRFKLTYPDSGPREIYDLGVPRAAAFVDHISDEAKAVND